MSSREIPVSLFQHAASRFGDQKEPEPEAQA
jgi:hypothetical protein